jgi:hypothetical protein
MSASVLARAIRHLVLGAAAVATAAGSADAQSSPDERDIAAYTLTMPAMRKAGMATERMLELVLRDEGLARELETLAQEEDESDAQSIADIVAAYDRMPKLKGAITGTGLSVREYVVMQLAMMQAAIVVGFQDPENSGKAITIPDGVSKANVAFVRANWDELQRMSARMQALQQELESRSAVAEEPEEPEEPGEPAEEPR